MKLVFSISKLVWQTHVDSAGRSESDERQTEALKSFLNALYRSHGREEKASGEHIDLWFTSGAHSFFTMLKPLLAILNTQASLAPLDLVVLAHWTHDTVIGHSVTNAVIHEAQADSAFGIAVSDHGISSSWLALSLIEDYLSETEAEAGNNALLLIADQSASLHDSPFLGSISPHPCAGAVLLKKSPHGLVSDTENKISFRGYKKICSSVSGNLFELRNWSKAFFDPAECDLPLVVITNSALASRFEQCSFANDIELQIWDDSLLSVAPWATLKQHASPSTRYLFLHEENQATMIAAFLSGRVLCI